MSTIAEKKAAYEQSSLKQLFDTSPSHKICERCFCCDSIFESAPCYQCGGFNVNEDDGEWYDTCSECADEGEVYYTVCAGGCDLNGEHKPKAT